MKWSLRYIFCFKNLILKIKGQCHPVHWYLFCFVSICPFLKYNYFKNLTLSHGWGHSLKVHSGSSMVPDAHPLRSMSIGPPKHEIRIFGKCPWKSKFNVIGKAKYQGHTVGPAIYRLTPFRSMSISHPIPGIRLFQNLPLKIHVQWLRTHIPSAQIPFAPCQLTHPFVIPLFPNMTLKIQDQGHGWSQNLSPNDNTDVNSQMAINRCIKLRGT